MSCQAVVVSGYLGAGKTSLVRHLLEEARRQGVRAAVVSNEFGELGIDAALLADSAEGYVEIEGGCVCCRLSGELIATLETLHQRLAPERVIVETSGAALPFETQLSFWRDPVARWIADDVAVVVVSAEQVLQQRDLDETFEQQVSSADLLVLSKTDLVGAEALPGIEARLREIEPEAPIVPAVHGGLDSALLFPPDLDGLRARRRNAEPELPPHDHAQLRTEVLEAPPGLSPEALQQWLGTLGSLRVKGFAATSEGLRLVQGVGPRVELSAPATPPPPHLVGRLVVIRRPAARPAQGSD